MKKIAGLLFFLIIITYSSICYASAESGQKTVTYSNTSYDYSFTVTDEVYLSIDKSEYLFEDPTVTINDPKNKFSAVLSCDRLDEETLDAMREYLNNKSLKDDEVFRKAVDYKESYFNALYDYYKRDFQYGGNDENHTETNIKVFGDYHGKVYGQDSHTTMFSTISSDKTASNEEIHINIMVPVRMTKSIYSIAFTVKRGDLTEQVINEMSLLVNSVRIFYLPKQVTPIDVFSDKAALNSANAGIYPELDKIELSYSDLINPKAGYKLTYPSVFIPYRQNNIVDSFDHQSFKIDYSSSFNISVSPVNSNNTAIRDKIEFFLKSYPGEIKFIDGGSLVYNGIEFTYLKYEIKEHTGETVYVQDYYAVKNSLLYDLQLNSKFSKPSQAVQDEFADIVKSFQFIPTESSSEDTVSGAAWFINMKEGFSFSYPDRWNMTVREAVYSSEYGDYEVYNIKSPDFSGSLDISIAVGELTVDLPYAQIIKYVTGTGTPALNRYFKSYSAPYFHNIYKPLAVSHYSQDGATYIFKLINYLDEAERSRLCYSVDIVVNMKIYSLFISVSDYITSNGRVDNSEVRKMINYIAKSFELR